jgi:hypothetical protein
VLLFPRALSPPLVVSFGPASLASAELHLFQLDVVRSMGMVYTLSSNLPGAEGSIAIVIMRVLQS